MSEFALQYVKSVSREPMRLDAFDQRFLKIWINKMLVSNRFVPLTEKAQT